MVPQTLCALVLLSVAHAAVVWPLFAGILDSRPDGQHVLGRGPSRGHTHEATDGIGSDDQNASGFVAFGDSYSAGIGTKVEGIENECRLGEGAYPALINRDMAERRRDPTSFQWMSCTGAVMDDVLSDGGSSQIDRFNATLGAPDAHPDFAMLSIGGNDLGFFDVMNACVFRFYSFYSGTCETALEASDAAVNSPDFEFRLSLVLNQILDKVQWEKRPWFNVTLTGYSRFFNDETTACDNASLGVWWDGPKLKQPVRRRMNDLVVAVNSKLRKTVDDFNSRFVTPKAFFVDYDSKFDGHRFCELNVTEPDFNRTETWFFLPGAPDNGPGSVPGPPGSPPPINRTATASAEVLPPSSALVDADTCLPAAQKSGDWGELALCYMAMAKQRDPSLSSANGAITPHSIWYVPTYYGKTFHPRTLGHRAIRDKVYEVWET